MDRGRRAGDLEVAVRRDRTVVAGPIARQGAGNRSVTVCMKTVVSLGAAASARRGAWPAAGLARSPVRSARGWRAAHRQLAHALTFARFHVRERARR